MVVVLAVVVIVALEVVVAMVMVLAVVVVAVKVVVVMAVVVALDSISPLPWLVSPMSSLLSSSCRCGRLRCRHRPCRTHVVLALGVVVPTVLTLLPSSRRCR